MIAQSRAFFWLACIAFATHAQAAKTSASTCTVQLASGAKVRFDLALPTWAGWDATCKQLAGFVDPPKPPLAPAHAGQASVALENLGLFDSAACLVTDDLQTLACALQPAQIVRSIAIAGHLPITLLREDLRRRIFLRPGTRLRDRVEMFARQEARLRDFLKGEGYFDAAVAVTADPTGGAQPSCGVHLTIAVSARQTATVRRVRLTGDIVLPTQTLAKPLLHRGVLGLPLRFRPTALADDAAKVVQTLRSKGYVGAHIRPQFTYHPEGRAVDIDAQVVAGRQVKVAVRGNTHVATRRILRLAPFAKTGAVDAVAVEQLRSSTLRLYQEAGYADAQVQATLGRDDARRLVVRLLVDEGQKHHVEAIVWRGVSADPTQWTAKARVLQHASSRWRRQPWVQAWIDHDITIFTGAMSSLGYADADIVPSRESGNTRGGIRLVYNVTAGAQTKVASLRLFGMPAQVASRPPLLLLTRGAPFWASAVDSDVQDLETALSREGYLAAKVMARLEDVPHKPNEVAVSYQIKAGEQVRLKGVFTRGTFRTRASTLTQELGIRPGMPLNLPALGSARRKLRALNIFNAVQLTPAYPRHGSSCAHLILSVEEREVRSLDGVAGYSSDFGFALGGDYRDRNLLGRAISLTVSARLSNAEHYLSRYLRIGNQDLAEARLQAPRPFGLPVDIEAQALYRYQDPRAFVERRVGGQIAATRQVLSRNRCKMCPDIQVRLGYELMQAFRADKDDLGRLTSIATPLRTIARLAPSIVMDTRDSSVDPHQGVAADLRLEGAHPALAGILGASATSFWRLLLNTQIYLSLGSPYSFTFNGDRTLGGPIVVALAGSYAAAGPFGPRGGVPDSETFGYGGDLSVRGLVTRASSAQIDNPDYLVTLSGELRYYALANFGLGSLQLAGFVDVGTVASALGALFAQTTLSAGPVLRYVTPVGPLSVAYGRALMLPDALRLSPDDAPPKGRWHFTFGYTF